MAIKRLVSTNAIANQDQLQKFLKKEGIDATQATLSRDLRELRIIKSHTDEAGYHYMVPSVSMEKHGLAEQANSIAGILSVEFSSFMAVIRTKPGYAGMVASMIDDTIGHTIMGTVAGDDTVFIALRDGTSKETILDNLEKIAPGISQKQL